MLMKVMTGNARYCRRTTAHWWNISEQKEQNHARSKVIILRLKTGRWHELKQHTIHLGIKRREFVCKSRTAIDLWFMNRCKSNWNLPPLYFLVRPSVISLLHYKNWFTTVCVRGSCFLYVLSISSHTLQPRPDTDCSLFCHATIQ
jgi:hypothetical protein